VRLFRSDPARYESFIAVAGSDERLLVRSESPTEVPNFHLDTLWAPLEAAEGEAARAAPRKASEYDAYGAFWHEATPADIGERVHRVEAAAGARWSHYRSGLQLVNAMPVEDFAGPPGSPTPCRRLNSGPFPRRSPARAGQVVASQRHAPSMPSMGPS